MCLESYTELKSLGDALLTLANLKERNLKLNEVDKEHHCQLVHSGHDLQDQHTLGPMGRFIFHAQENTLGNLRVLIMYCCAERDRKSWHALQTL